MQILHKTTAMGGRPVAYYNLDVMISVGYRVKSPEGVRFRRWATRILREMLLNRLDEIKRIGSLERRMDAAEGDIRQIRNGMNYLVQQLSAPLDTPRKRIGFSNADAPSAKPYGKA
ncbi:MAG: virulence RhuM family protein [Kiritimatiellae bacterium]|nr:virulence RhuM family protein [Kiritimatiellia bacterium]